MTSTLKVVLAFVVLGVVSAVLAQSATPAVTGSDPTAVEAAKAAPTMAKALGIVGACVGAAGAAIGGGFGIARIGSRCVDAIARQPEAAGSMFAPMIVTAAMVEGGMLFAMVVCLLGVLGI
jgi:F-type H+-transporting ATPase subunit c